MKKFFALAAIFVLAFTACEQPTNEDNTQKLPSLTIRNQSSYDLTNVKFEGITFAVSGSNDLPRNEYATKQLTANDLNKTGYITFTRKDIGIALRTEAISVADQDLTFTFMNSTIVEEQANTGNKNSLAQISFQSRVAIEYGSLPVAKNQTLDFGEVVVNNTKPVVFTLKNTGVGKLLLHEGGTEPVKISGDEAAAFSVNQPANPEIAPDGSLPFTINFRPTTVQPYTATVTVISNDQNGAFTFTITGAGVSPKPIATVLYGVDEILQNGTIDAGEEFITQSKNITVAIRNTGAAPLTVDTGRITITGADSAAFIKTTDPADSISAGNQSSFFIECKPVKQGENNAILTIPTNDDSRNPIIIYLKVTGNRGSGILELTQAGTPIGNNSITPLDFGRAEVGAGPFPSLTFTVKNTGNISLELTGDQPVVSLNVAFTVTQPANRTLSPELDTTTFTVQYIPTAEGDHTGTITIANNGDGGSFTLNVKGTGYIRKPKIDILYDERIYAQEETIDAGQVLITLSKTIDVIIKNNGELVLNLDTALISIRDTDTGTDSLVFTKNTGPTTPISVGGQSLFRINCSPVKEGENTAILTIPSNDPIRNQAVVFLKVTGVKGSAVLELKNGDTIIGNNSSTPVPFGQAVVGGAPMTVEFNITNKGNIALNLTGDPAIESSNPVFSVSTPPATTTLNPAASTTFRVRYTPTAEREDTSTITIANNSDAGTFSFTVAGNGYAYKPVASILYNEEVIAQNGTIHAGEILVTTSNYITITIKNTGDAELTINQAEISITGDDAQAFKKATNPGVSVQPDREASFTIECSPVKQGENNATLMIPTNDPLRNPVTTNLKATGVKGYAIPQLSQGSTIIQNNALTPVDFGQVIVGGNTPLTFTIKNTGNIALDLTGTPVIESSNSVFAIPTQPTTRIQPNAEVSFNIRYTPTTEGEDTATITFANNSDDMEFSFTVKGTGYIQKPQITVRQGSSSINPSGEYDFGAVTAGETKELIFTIGNSGDANLTFVTVDNNRINLANNESGYFSVIQQPTASTTVAPEGETTFAIRYSPATMGPNFTATVQIKTNSRNDDEFSFAVRGSSSLAVPASVTVAPQSSSSILLSWNPVPGATSYNVYYGTSSSAITTLASGAVTGTSYTHTGLLAGTTYYYCITAQADAGESGRSQAASTITMPGIPANLRSTASTNNSISLEWDAVTGAVSYRVYYATSAAGDKTLAGTVNNTVAMHTGLPANTTYYYFVTAVNNSGEGAYTEALSVRTLLAPLSAPSNVTATGLSTTSIEVTWGAVSGAVNYKVYRATSATGTKTLLDTVTTTSFTSGGLSEATYWYFVTASNTDNVESAFSAYASMRPKPNAPSDIWTTVYNGEFEVQVGWVSVTGATSYRIYYSTSSTGTKTLAGTTTSRSYFHSGITANTTYYYWVTAVNIGGESDYSLQKSALTPPAAPTNLRVTAKTPTSITLAWDAVPGAVEYYIGGSTSFTTNGTTLTMNGGTPQTSYSFYIYARNSAGVSGPEVRITASTN